MSYESDTKFKKYYERISGDSEGMCPDKYQFGLSYQSTRVADLY